MSNPILPPRVPSSDFPSDVLKWMKENAGPKKRLKLMKCHKFFQYFPEFPYFVVKKVQYNDSENEWNIIRLDDMGLTHEELEIITSKKLWITEWIRLIRAPNIIIQLNLIPKIAVCEIERLALYGQEISFNDFKFLTASGTVYMLILQHTKICFENSEPVFIDSILKCVPNVTKLEYFNAEEPNILPNFFNAIKEFDVSKFKRISFKMTCYRDFVMFSKFMNKNPHIKYKLSFDADSLSNVKTEILKFYVQGIIDKGLTENPPPDITYPGQLDMQWRALRTLRNNYKNLKKIRKLKSSKNY